MAIEFSCQCGKQIKVSEKFAGRRAKCPGCGEPVVIPNAEGSRTTPSVVGFTREGERRVGSVAVVFPHAVLGEELFISLE